MWHSPQNRVSAKTATLWLALVWQLKSLLNQPVAEHTRQPAENAVNLAVLIPKPMFVKEKLFNILG